MAGSIKPTGGLGGTGFGARPGAVDLNAQVPGSEQRTAGMGNLGVNQLQAQVMPGTNIKNFLANIAQSTAGSGGGGFNWKNHGGGLEQNEVLAGMLENGGVSQDTIEYYIGKAEEPMTMFMVHMSRRSPTFFYRNYQKIKEQFTLDQETGAVCPLKKEFITDINKVPSFHTTIAVNGGVIFGFLLIEDMKKTGKEQWSESDFNNASEIACYQALFMEMLNWLFNTKKGVSFTHRLPKKLEMQLANLETIKDEFSKMWEMFDVPFPYAQLSFVNTVSTPVEYQRVFDPDRYGEYLGYVPQQHRDENVRNNDYESINRMVDRNVAERRGYNYQEPPPKPAASQNYLNEVHMTWGTTRSDFENLTRENMRDFDLQRFFKPIGLPNHYFIPESDWRKIQKVYRRHPEMKQEEGLLRDCYRVVVIDFTNNDGWFSHAVRAEGLDVARVFSNPELLLPKLEKPENDGDLYMVVAAPMSEVVENEKLEVNIERIKDLGDGIPAIVVDEQIIAQKTVALMQNVSLVTDRVTAKFKGRKSAAVFDDLVEWDVFTCSKPEDKTRLFLDAPYLFVDADLKPAERPSIIDAGKHLRRLFNEGIIDNELAGFINNRMTSIVNEWLVNVCGYNAVDGKGGGGKLQIDNFVADIEDLVKEFQNSDDQAYGVLTDGNAVNYLTHHLQLFHKQNPFGPPTEELGILERIKDDVDLYVVRHFYLANLVGDKGPYHEEFNVPLYIKRSKFPELFRLMDIVVEEEGKDPQEVYKDRLLRFADANHTWLFSYTMGDRNVATLRHVDTNKPLVLMGVN